MYLLYKRYKMFIILTKNQTIIILSSVVILLVSFLDPTSKMYSFVMIIFPLGIFKDTQGTSSFYLFIIHRNNIYTYINKIRFYRFTVNGLNRFSNCCPYSISSVIFPKVSVGILLSKIEVYGLSTRKKSAVPKSCLFK